MDFSRASKCHRLLAVVAAFALVATACGSGDDDDGANGDAPAPPAALDEFVGTGVFAGPFTDETVDAGIARLAESGIAVIPDGGGSPIVAPTEPASPLILLEFQARNLVADAAGNGGFLGANLDALVLPDPETPDAPVPSQVLAAYVHGVDTPGAELSRELVGDQELAQPGDVVFPSMVVTLFVSDVARAVQGLTETTPGSPDADDPDGDGESAAPVAMGDDDIQLISARQPICPNFAGAIEEMIRDILKILKIPNITVPDTGIPILTQILQAGADLFVGFLNFAIDAAATFLIEGIKVLLKPVFSVVTTIAAVFAVTTSIVNALRPWTVQRIPADISVHRGVGAPATQEIAIRVTVPGLEEWPATLTSCAKSLGLTVPPLRPHGGRVKWELIDPRGLTSVVSKEDTLDDTSQARITLEVLGQETRKQHNEGVEHSELVRVNATLTRQEVETFKTTIKELIRGLFAGVPAIIKAHLTYYSDHAADFVLDSITDDVINLVTPLWVTVSYHGDPRDEDEPDPPNRIPPATGSGAVGTIPEDCPSASAIGPGFEYSPRDDLVVAEGKACRYFKDDCCWVTVGLVSRRVVETEVPGQLGFTSGASYPDFLERRYQPLDLTGAEAAWTYLEGDQEFPQGDVVAVVGERTMLVNFFGGPSLDLVIAAAERILGTKPSR